MRDNVTYLFLPARYELNDHHCRSYEEIRERTCETWSIPPIIRDWLLHLRLPAAVPEEIWVAIVVLVDRVVVDSLQHYAEGLITFRFSSASDTRGELKRETRDKESRCLYPGLRI
jgi:hypothetical protein